MLLLFVTMVIACLGGVIEKKSTMGVLVSIILFAAIDVSMRVLFRMGIAGWEILE